MDELSERAVEWADRIERQQSSEMSVALFCEYEGVSTPSFYPWRKRLAQAASPQPVFVPLTVKQDSAGTGFDGICIDLPNDVRISLPGDIDERRLAVAIRAAGELAAGEVNAC